MSDFGPKPEEAVAELISVIVTTFNREDALDAVLRSLSIQGDRDFEVIVADDGSSAATAKLIGAWKPKFAYRLEHVWHADQASARRRSATVQSSPRMAATAFFWTVTASCAPISSARIGGWRSPAGS